MHLLTDEKERASDSPYVDQVSTGRTALSGVTTRPAECQMHMCVVRFHGRAQVYVTGPLTTSGQVKFVAGAEILWIRFRLGAFLPQMPARDVLDVETVLPGAARHSFWLHGAAWHLPDYENVDTFVDRLVRADVLAFDPVVGAALSGHPLDLSPRTLRHRFLRATGLTQGRIRQVERAKQAAAFLRQGRSILDTVDAAGYFDQPHLTRALKQWVGYTPAELIRRSTPACRSVQDAAPGPGYPVNVLTAAG